MAASKETHNAAVRAALAKYQAGAGPHALEPEDHLAFALLSKAGMGPEEALAVLQRLRETFVDWNEVRVASLPELMRCIGTDANAQDMATELRQGYNALFEARNTITMDFLNNCKPTEAKRALGQIMPLVPRPAVLLLVHQFCGSVQLPISANGVRQARKESFVSNSADANQVYRAISDALTPAERCLMVQYWELAATGNPYGETKRPRPPRPPKDATKKTPAKPKKDPKPKAAKKPASKKK